MTLLAYVHTFVLPAAYALLPRVMQSPEATVLLLAIALQESKLRHRRQHPSGPARGFWQFEQDGGVDGVIVHRASAKHLAYALEILRYQVRAEDCYRAIQDNDVLAAIFGRLLLWTDPAPLPAIGDVSTAYSYYLRNWKPGKPRSLDWPESYARALEQFDGPTETAA